jgi:hypothetical protein
MHEMLREKEYCIYTCYPVHGQYAETNRGLPLRELLYKRLVVVPRETLMHYSQD